MEGDASTRASSSKFPGENSDSDSTIEINIKTLDSRIYSFRVNKDMAVPTLKGKLVDITGIPVERQRLIFRGRVLKDDHLLSEYHLEDGHTLHLVERQPSSGTGSEGMAADNNNQGNDSNPSAPRVRFGQAHSVLLGTVNIAEQGENMVADIGRLVGSVLSSLGVGTPNSAATNMPPPGAANQVPTSVDAERTQNTGGRPISGNPAPASFTVVNNPLQFVHQSPPFPPTGLLPRNMVIPDSLTTLTDFISRMELILQNGSDSSANNVQGPPGHENMPSNQRGLPTPEMLRMVMEQAQQLLRGNSASALCHLASRLEREGPSTDSVVRGQIQAEAMHVGAAMQHLGALFLELGRTIMTLRMGQSPADAVVNAGPAVYISSAGPNPLMVQPSPLQSHSLFGVSVPPLVNGDASRNINIHIHAGSSAAASSNAASSQSSREAVHGESSGSEPASRDNNNNNSRSTAPAQGLTSRTVVAAIPARSATQTSGHVLSVIYPVQVRSQLSVPLHAAPPQVPHTNVSSGGQSSAPTGLGSSVQTDPQVPHSQSAMSGQGDKNLASGTPGLSSSHSRSESGTLDAGNRDGGDSSSQQISELHQKSSYDATNLSASVGSVVSVGLSSKTASGVPPVEQHSDTVSNCRSLGKNPDSAGSTQSGQSTESPTPLGLGLGGLQPKRRGKMSKPVGKDKGSRVSPAVSQNQQSVAIGQHILQSLVSQRSGNDPTNAQSPSRGQNTDGLLSESRSESQEQVDAADMMSHILRTPAINNLLSGVAAQTGIGSSADLRNMLEQCTQNPAVRNTLNGITQHVGQSQNVGDMFSGISGGQGGLDFSSMIQQMLPAVSQALGRGSMNVTSTNAVQPDNQTQRADAARGGLSRPSDSLGGLDHVAERISQNDAPVNIFRSVLESVSEELGEGNSIEDLANELGDNEELANEYRGMLSRDLHKRTMTDSSPEQ